MILARIEKDLLKLISRFDISSSQAAIILHPSKREEVGLNFENKDILENPYQIFEQTRHTV